MNELTKLTLVKIRCIRSRLVLFFVNIITATLRRFVL